MQNLGEAKTGSASPDGAFTEAGGGGLFLGRGATFFWPAELSDPPQCCHIFSPLPACFNHERQSRRLLSGQWGSGGGTEE